MWDFQGPAFSWENTYWDVIRHMFLDKKMDDNWCRMGYSGGYHDESTNPNMLI